MLDTASQRAAMVASQLRPNDVRDARIRDAMLTIPRERFVPPAAIPVAYAEDCISLGSGRVLADPRAFAKLLQLAAVGPDDTVLDVGCATGYSSAVLSLLAGRVIALEEDPVLARQAEQNLQLLSANVHVVRGPFAAGCAERGPYDVIFVNGSIEAQPAGLLSQLKDGGRLTAIWRQGAAGQARLYVNHAGAIGERSDFNAFLPVLPGLEKPSTFVF
jgi:protein-L-isoaspartate(D-aspartate) O-methyltransferase